MTTPTFALSIRQPWAWLILHGKDVENRSWATKFRGRFLIHAAKGMTRKEYDYADYFSHFVTVNSDKPLNLPPFDDLPRGGIVGDVDLHDCVTASKSGWFTGPYGLLLREPRSIPFHPFKCALGFFRCEL